MSNTKPAHGETRPAHEVYGLEVEPPIPCAFKIGDVVTYTNDYGCKFPDKKVLGFAKKVQSWGGFVHLERDSWWFPVPPNSLTLQS